MTETLHLDLARRWAYHFNARTQYVGNDHALIEKIRRELASAFPHRIETIIQNEEQIGKEYLFSDGSRCAFYHSHPGKIVFPSNNRAATASPQQ